jgi:hypothetical protein
VIIRRQISPAAAERDSQWRTRDDHSGIPSVEKLNRLVQRISTTVNAARERNSKGAAVEAAVSA